MNVTSLNEDLLEARWSSLLLKLKASTVNLKKLCSLYTIASLKDECIALYTYTLFNLLLNNFGAAVHTCFIGVSLNIVFLVTIISIKKEKKTALLVYVSMIRDIKVM